MTRFLMAGAAALAMAAFSTGSYAVDLTNKDSQSYYVTTFNDDGGWKEFQIGAGETIKGVCGEACMLVLGKDVKMLTNQPSLSAHDPQHALIKDGKITVQ